MTRTDCGGVCNKWPATELWVSNSWPCNRVLRAESVLTGFLSHQGQEVRSLRHLLSTTFHLIWVQMSSSPPVFPLENVWADGSLQKSKLLWFLNRRIVNKGFSESLLFPLSWLICSLYLGRASESHRHGLLSQGKGSYALGSETSGPRSAHSPVAHHVQTSQMALPL